MYCDWFELENPSEILKKAGSDPSGSDVKKSKGKKSMVMTNLNYTQAEGQTNP